MSMWGNVPPAPGTQGFYGLQPNMPAYTPVQVRQTFSYPQAQIPQYVPPQPQPHVTPVQPSRPKIDWPPSVREYVQKAFNTTKSYPEIAKSEIESKLKETISTATDNGTLWDTDWSIQPLPQQLIRNERAAWSSVVPTFVASNFPQYPPAAASKKRKSQDGEEESTSSLPWRNTNKRNGFEDRISHPVEHNDAPALSKSTSKFQKAIEKRQRKFDGGYKSTYQKSPTPVAESGPVVGTSTELEKKYFRLTSAPIPSQVRPLPILKQTLELLKKKWRKESSYSYICDQFKSLRQDLTVQRIRDKFTVEVYEIHARIALEKGDLGEYNQCQTQLRVLYGETLGGNPTEFKAYRILYFIHTSNRTALNDVLADLTTAEKEDPAVKHALSVRSALALGNYHRFFRLYLETPNMGAYLMDMFVVRERLAAISNICKAYKQSVSLRFVTEELGFESDADSAQFIDEYKGGHLLEERDTGVRFMTAKAGATFETAKVQAFRKVDIRGQI